MTTEKIKIRSLCIDTLTGIMDNLYMAYRKKPGHDIWKDWAQDLWEFNTILQDLGFETILIYGNPGTGKSTGMMNLPHNTNVWFNADNKNPLWVGGKEEYGKKNQPRQPFHVIPKTYEEIISHIEKLMKKGLFEEERYAFLTGHTETYKEGLDFKTRLQIVGNLSNKMGIERKFETVFQSKVIIEDNKPKYIFETQNDGFNTVRSPMNLFDAQIPNDYNYVINKLLTL